MTHDDEIRTLGLRFRMLIGDQVLLPMRLPTVHADMLAWADAKALRLLVTTELQRALARGTVQPGLLRAAGILGVA